MPGGPSGHPALTRGQRQMASQPLTLVPYLACRLSGGEGPVRQDRLPRRRQTTGPPGPVEPPPVPHPQPRPRPPAGPSTPGRSRSLPRAAPSSPPPGPGRPPPACLLPRSPRTATVPWPAWPAAASTSTATATATARPKARLSLPPGGPRVPALTARARAHRTGPDQRLRAHRRLTLSPPPHPPARGTGRSDSRAAAMPAHRSHSPSNTPQATSDSAASPRNVRSRSSTWHCVAA